MRQSLNNSSNLVKYINNHRFTGYHKEAILEFANKLLQSKPYNAHKHFNTTQILVLDDLASIVINSDEVNHIVDIVWDEDFDSYVQYKTKI